MNGITLPGLNLEEIRKIVPDIQTKDGDFPDDSTPWNHQIVGKPCEEKSQFEERVK